ncbi:MAG: ABC transporter permease [Pseudomonadota bacterium]
MNPEIVLDNAARLLEGVQVSLALVGCSLLIAALIAVPLAVLLRSPNGVLRTMANGYSAFFRGSPLIAQLFLIYYGSGQFRPALESIGVWWFFRDAFLCAVLTFSLNSAAYTAELLRGAIDAVPKGQWEAARALGLSRMHLFFKIILPQAFRTALPAYGNEVILLVKASALALVVTVYDLMGTVRLIYSRTFDLSIFFWAAIVYIVFVEVLRILFRTIETRAFRWHVA